MKDFTMYGKLRMITCLFAFFALALNIKAQTQSQLQKASSIDVNSLSDEQIQQIVQQATAKGLTMDQAMQMARMQGASQSQIDQLMMRINGMNTGNSTTYGNSSYNKSNQFSSDEIKNLYSEKAKFKISEKNKKIFGFNFFNSENLTFEPSVNIPIPKDYILGTNDELTVNVWGSNQQVYKVTVDQNGCIYIPGAGQIYVKGSNFEEARRVIKRRLTSIYAGMAGAYPSAWADVSISNLRSIKVNVLGEVMAPGSYTLPATASAFNALYLSGGPNENGSFRNIKIIRDNRVIKIVDVYDFLINSKTSCNIALRDQDIIYVPTYESRIDVEGAFKRTGYFELKDGEAMDKLFRYSGGFKSNAYKHSVSVSRMNDMDREVLDVYLTQFRSFKPVNGDSITAGVILDRYENRVKISGAVFRPGTYSLSEGMKLSQLIDKAQGLREDAFPNRGIIYRLDKDLTPTSIPFATYDVQKGISDFTLQREDSVVIQDISTLREKRFVKILGEVQKEGEYPFNEGMSISDLVLEAGGFKEAASESFIEVARRHSYERAASMDGDLVDLFQFKIDRSLKLSDNDKNFVLSPFDYVYVRKAPSYFEQKTVTIEGEVMYPGDYSIRSKSERISDLIRRSGGLTQYAYVKGCTLYRETSLTDKKGKDKDKNKEFSKQGKDSLSMANLYEPSLAFLGKDTAIVKANMQLEEGRVELQLDKILKDTSSIYNYYLKEGDRIVVPEISEEVRVIGEILNPVGLAYESGKSAKYYIDCAGGFSDKANSDRVYVVNSDGTARVTKNFLFFKSYPKVQPGSKIIVPEKPDKAQVNVSTWLAMASTFSSIAIAIAAIFK